jgi:hypothetical protein
MLAVPNCIFGFNLISSKGCLYISPYSRPLSDRRTVSSVKEMKGFFYELVRLTCLLCKREEEKI